MKVFIFTLAIHHITATFAFTSPLYSGRTVPSIASFRPRTADSSFQRQYPPSINADFHNRNRKLSINTCLEASLSSLPFYAYSAQSLKRSASLMANLHKDDFYVLSITMLVSVFGLILEEKTQMGKALSAGLATMGVALVIANLGLVPFASPVYSFVNKYLVALAIPLLLFDSDLRRAVTDTGTLLIAFLVGTLSTIIGTLIAFKFLPLKSLGKDAWKVASALAARHIGGAINFVAVSETLNMSGSTVTAAIAADNVVTALYFALLFTLAKEGEEPSSSRGEGKTMGSDVKYLEGTRSNQSISMTSLATSMAAALCLVTIGKFATNVFFPSSSALPMITLATVAAATMSPRFFKGLSSTGTAVGIIFMQMFLFTAGAAGSIRLVIEQAPSLFAFSALLVGIHFFSLIGIGRLILRLKPNELYLASNANVGGPTTAAAMASGKGWKKLVVPALLVGIFGYGTATPVALGLGHLLQKF